MAREWRGFFEEHIGDLLRAAATANEADRLLRVAEGHRRVVAPLLALGYGVLSCAVLLKAGFRRAGPTACSFALGTAIIGWHGAMALGHGLIGRIPQLVPIYYALAVLPALAGFSLLAAVGRRSATVGG